MGRRNRRRNEIAQANRGRIVAADGSPPANLTQVRQEISYSGPPPASYFVEFDKLGDGEGRRELEHYRSQTMHRHWAEKKVLEGDNARAWAGIGIAALLAVAMLGSGIFLAMNGHEAVANTIYSSGFWPFAAVFAVGAGTRALERLRRWAKTGK